MKKPRYNQTLPRYRGHEWVQATLPRKCELWAPGNPRSMGKDRSHYRSLSKELETLITRDSKQLAVRRKVDRVSGLLDERNLLQVFRIIQAGAAAVATAWNSPRRHSGTAR